ncbi:MAG: hypothetical protein IH621_03020 [Krumholzibacteria bacterium]|nr:hypothetical protein [Candidatus Krumholzibacteria bacterium]
MSLTSLRAALLHRDAAWALAAVGLGLALFLWRFDPAVVAPRNVDRLLAVGGDPTMNALGWEYFRSEPWSWPPGRIGNYGAPFGSSIGLVDGIPLLGLPGKLLGGRWTGPWQYFGIWLLASYLLQAFVSWQAVGLVLRRHGPRLLATALLLLMPAFLRRTGHMALTAHWLVLLALVLYGRRAGPAAWLILVAVASLCHPYLTAMVLAVAVAYQLKAWLVDRTSRPGRMAAVLGAMAVLVAAGWWLGGLFVYGPGVNEGVYGFGRFSANLNTLFNPLQAGRLLPPLPLMHDEQIEGFNYLGLGLLALWGLAVATVPGDRSVLRRLRAHWPLVGVLGILAAFAVSSTVTWGDRLLRDVALPEALTPLTGAFRASGRFLWPVTYAGTLYALAALGRTCGGRAQTALLAGLLLVQIVDLGPTLRRRALFASERIETRLADPAWATVMARTERLLTVPPLEAGTQFPYDFRDLVLPLMGRGVPTSAAYLTRSDPARTRQWSADLLAGLAAGRRPAPGTTFVVRDTELPAYLAALTPEFAAYNLDGFRVLVDRSIPLPGAVAYLRARPGRLAAFLAEHAGHTLALAAKDEATRNLGEPARGALRARGFEVERLEYRCSFAAVLAPGGAAWQEIRNDRDVRHAVGQPVLLEIHSAGLHHGNLVSIRLDGIEHAVASRGLNILALDADWQPVALGVFDTYLDDGGWSLEYRRPSPLKRRGAP